MPVPNKSKTQCNRGHPLSGENLYVSPAKYRICRACVRLTRARGRSAEQSVPPPLVVGDAEALRDALLGDIRAEAKKQWRVLPTAKGHPDTLLVVSPVDVHFGALAWGPATGGASYDLKIANQLFRGTCESLLARGALMRPAQIILRIGDDLITMDGPENMTAGGTPQDVDGRFQQVFRVAVAAVAHVARRCAEVAPTRIIVQPGNHDLTASFMVGQVLGAMFADHPRIVVDPALTPRQYFQWGTVGLGFAHGHGEKPEALPLLFAAEAPQIWAATTYREWMLGHLHRSRKMNADEYCGVRVRWLPSIKPQDEWHATQGYVNATRAMEATVYSKARGYLATLSEPVAA